MNLNHFVIGIIIGFLGYFVIIQPLEYLYDILMSWFMMKKHLHKINKMKSAYQRYMELKSFNYIYPKYKQENEMPLVDLSK